METKKHIRERVRKASCTVEAKTAETLQRIPEGFAADLLHLTLCCRYIEALIHQPRVKRYVSKYHPATLTKLEALLSEFNSSFIVLRRRKKRSQPIKEAKKR